MTMLIACILIYGFKLHWVMYIIAAAIWVCHLVHHDDSESFKVIIGNQVKLGKTLTKIVQKCDKNCQDSELD